MPGPKLTPPQKERVKAGGCACGCGEEVGSWRAYPEPSDAHRKRAQRERAAWEASGAAARHELQQRLDRTVDDLASLTRRIDQLSAQRTKLRELATDLQARLSPQVELPVLTPEPSSPAGVTGAKGQLEQLHPVDVVWRMRGAPQAELRYSPPGRYQLWEGRAVGRDVCVGWLPANQGLKLARAGLLIHIDGGLTAGRAPPATAADIRKAVKQALAAP